MGIGAAFFGWLTATGTAVLLTALVAAAGTAVGLATGSNAREAASNVASASRTTRLVGAIAVLVVVLGAVAGEKYNIFAQLNVFPRIPVNEGLLTTSGILTAVAVALASLLGAMLGGGSRDAFHRKVDRAGYTADAYGRTVTSVLLAGTRRTRSPSPGPRTRRPRRPGPRTPGRVNRP